MTENPLEVRFRWSSAHWGRLFLLSIVSGLLGGLAAAGVEWGLQHLVPLLVGRFSQFGGAALFQAHPAVLALPVLGGAVSVVAHKLLGGVDLLGGTERLVRAFHVDGGRLGLRGPITRSLANIFVIACGGSTGAEGPIAALGAAIGSSIAGLVGLHARERRTFLLAGCAGGVSAMFRCPLGGALFATTILYREPENEDDALMPSIVSAVMAYAAFTSVWGHGEPLLERTQDLRFGGPLELLAYLLLAALCAGAAALLNLSLRAVASLRLERRLPWWAPPLVGGLAVGVIACVVPQVMDARYRFLQNALDGVFFRAGDDWGAWARLFLAVVVAKCVATAFTVGTGQIGGTLGPSVFIGGAVGALTGALGEAALPGVFPEELRRALIPVGMAGMLAAALRIPLAAAVMTIEITRSYGLIVPAIFVTAAAYVLGRRFGINHEQRGTHADSPAHAGREIVNVLESQRVQDLMEATWPHRTTPRTPLVAAFPEGAPPETTLVLDHGRLVGLVTAADLAGAPRPEVAVVADVMRPPPEALDPDDDIRKALAAFGAQPVDLLPVASGRRGKFAGVLSRTAIYRRLRERIDAQRATVLAEYGEIAALEHEGTIEDLVGGVSPSGGEGLDVLRIPVPQGAVGLSLREAQFRTRFGFAVLGVRTAAGGFDAPPDPEKKLDAKDVLFVIEAPEKKG